MIAYRFPRPYDDIFHEESLALTGKAVLNASLPHTPKLVIIVSGVNLNGSLSSFVTTSILSRRPISFAAMSYIADILYPRQPPQRRRSHRLFCYKSDTRTLFRPSPHHPFRPYKRPSPGSVAELRNPRM